MFRKKKEEPSVDDEISAPPMKPFSKKGSHSPSRPPIAPTFNHETPRRPSPEIPRAHTRQAERISSGAQDSKQLVIGRDIRLSGEITSCNRLLVEGRADVTLQGAHTINVAASGFFKGFADVQVADISGHFEGELVAHDQLIIRAGGHINGSVRYGRIVIEAGGKVSGDMQALETVATGEDGAAIPAPMKPTMKS
ncbi:MAG: polymer-forming cytoskeletal protein [Proteobacteria bacterium]|nr:polymer-forming cytoskeletal protein [Pseudomonadota bacterium]